MPMSIYLTGTFRKSNLLSHLLTFSCIYRSLLRSATREMVLAPTIAQRLEYTHWLHVYGKDTSRVPARMQELIDQYHVCHFCLFPSQCILLLFSTHFQNWTNLQTFGILMRVLISAMSLNLSIFEMRSNFLTTSLFISAHSFLVKTVGKPFQVVPPHHWQLL